MLHVGGVELYGDVEHHEGDQDGFDLEVLAADGDDVVPKGELHGEPDEDDEDDEGLQAVPEEDGEVLLGEEPEVAEAVLEEAGVDPAEDLLLAPLLLLGAEAALDQGLLVLVKVLPDADSCLGLQHLEELARHIGHLGQLQKGERVL